MWSKYKVIDNILNYRHFSLIKNINFETDADQWEIYKHQIFLDKTVKISYKNSLGEKSTSSSPLRLDDVLEIYDTYNSLMLKQLEDLAPEKISQYKFTELNVVSNGKDYRFPIHNDSKDKLLSVVIYISPQVNNGTYLYQDGQGNGMEQIEWIPNRAFIFSRNNETWHSYQSNNIDSRLTLVYNLRG